VGFFYRLGGGVTSFQVLRGAMHITINGEGRSFDGVFDVAGLVAALGLDVRKVAVERNLEIVPRSTYGETALSDGDMIEIVAFIGGG
jgi:sulfur carrier protein